MTSEPNNTNIALQQFKRRLLLTDKHDYLKQTWYLQSFDKEDAAQIQSSYSLSPPIARLMAIREYKPDSQELKNFLEPQLSELYDPFLLTDIDKAISRIDKAIEKQEKIYIYGDYDTDGITATSLLKLTFDLLGIDVKYYIPHRLDEGYGVSIEAINFLATEHANLIITVDTGISAHKEIAYATQKGIDIIVTDHHIPYIHNDEEVLPQAIAVINPKRKDCKYPNDQLAGVGVAFKFAHALLRSKNVERTRAQAFLMDMLSLVALGTIADNAPLVSENRAIVFHGLEHLKKTKLPGIVGIRKALSLDTKMITTKVVGFKIAPRLNAAGRTDHAGICVELLTANNVQKAVKYMGTLSNLNQSRRDMELSILKQAQKIIDEDGNFEDDQILVVAGNDWHVGVIGIVASRLMEKYHKPCIVISVTGDVGKGSARSTKDFNIHDALLKTEYMLTSFGGHSFAAGFQIPNGEIPMLRRELNRYASQMCTQNKYSTKNSLDIDSLITPYELCTQQFMNDLIRIEPYGPSNLVPVFLLKNVYIAPSSVSLTSNHQHIRFRVQCCSHEVYATLFNCSSIYKDLQKNSNDKAPVDIAFSPIISDYFGEPKLEMDIKGLCPSKL